MSIVIKVEKEYTLTDSKENPCVCRLTFHLPADRASYLVTCLRDSQVEFLGEKLYDTWGSNRRVCRVKSITVQAKNWDKLATKVEITERDAISILQGVYNSYILRLQGKPKDVSVDYIFLP